MKTLLVTGGTGGLGSQVVERLSRDYRCVLLTRDDLANMKSAIEKAGSFYGVVHLVGGFTLGAVSETTSETWSQMIESNLTVAFTVIHEALGKIERPGRIVAISSVASIEKPKGIAAYVVSKSALNTLIEVTAKEVAGTGITANALLPDTLDTPASRQSQPKARRVPLDRVADSIAFLLSDAAANINGALIPLRA
jgi:NAD(P)-dependent dehydrogenase (short-subunit alcohol dehydrogenase family)